jgi:PKD repeat protein
MHLRYIRTSDEKLNYSVTFGINGCQISSRAKLIFCCILIGLMTIGNGFALAQMATPSAPGLNMNAAATPIVPADYSAYGAAPSVIGPGLAAQPGINATLFGDPEFGSAPLTVDFMVILTNPLASMIYQWNFGDGSVSSLPATTVIPHVYQHAGTYLCSLIITASGGRSAAAFTTIVVRPREN